MLDQNKEFYKLVEKLVGSQFAAENGIMYELDMDLINEIFKHKTSRKKLQKKKMKEKSEKHQDWLEEIQIVEKSQEQEQLV